MRIYFILISLGQLIIQTAVGQVNFATPYKFITMAGGGEKDTGGIPLSGFRNGQGPGVQFQSPWSVVVDKDRNIYVGDTWNCVIRKITPTGNVTTFAGVPSQALNIYGFPISGYLDGPATNALFLGPIVGCVDSAGNLYVSDHFNHLIRMITPQGTVTTVAGRVQNYNSGGYPTGGYTDGIGTNALFSYPQGLAVDSNSNLYVADSHNSMIRRITPDGTVTTIAGSGRVGGGGDGISGYADGIGTNALFNFPTHIAIDSAGNLFVTDAFNDCIRKITPVVTPGETNWTVTTVLGRKNDSGVGGYADGTGTNALFDFPNAIAIDAADDLYVGANNFTIRKITPDANVTTIAGGHQGYTDGSGNEIGFHDVYGLAVDDTGNVYVADNLNNVIRKGWDATAKPVVVFESPSSTNAVLQLNFTVMTGTATNFTLLETSQLGAAWTACLDAVATTNVFGLSYSYAVPVTNTARFYRVQAQ